MSIRCTRLAWKPSLYPVVVVLGVDRAKVSVVGEIVLQLVAEADLRVVLVEPVSDRLVADVSKANPAVPGGKGLSRREWCVSAFLSQLESCE